LNVRNSVRRKLVRNSNSLTLILPVLFKIDKILSLLLKN
jgi:hypothetical protein